MKYNAILRPSFINCCSLVQTTSAGLVCWKELFHVSEFTGSEQNALANSAAQD